MRVEYEEAKNRFIISEVQFTENALVQGLPDRSFRKGSRTWAAPALHRNAGYMQANFPMAAMTPDAMAAMGRGLSQKRAAGKFPSWFNFKNPPMKHQAKALDRAVGQDMYALFFEQGLGKTYTTVNLASAWRMEGSIRAAVTVCLSAIKLVWEDELAEHCPLSVQPHVLRAGKNKAAFKFIEEDHDFPWLIMGIESLSQGKAHEVLQEFLLSRPSVMALDESSTIKTPNKVRTNRCLDFGRLAAKRLILSGTSVTQGIEDLYTQYTFLSPNLLGFNSYVSFKAHFCKVEMKKVAKDRYVQNIVGYKNEDELIRLISPVTSRVDKADAADLPDKVFQRHTVEMTPEQRRLYREMKDEQCSTMGGSEYEVATVLEKTLRLQQITGGHYPWDDGERVKPVPIPGKNPKVEALMQIIGETRGKVIIWFQFRPELELVAVALREAGIDAVQFHGGCDDTQKKHAVHAIQNESGVRVFLATRAAAYGLTLTRAHLSLYFSQGPSLEQFSQSQDRVHRIGQAHTCTYILLVCKATVDVDIQRSLTEKGNTARMVYDSMKAGEALADEGLYDDSSQSTLGIRRKDR